MHRYSEGNVFEDNYLLTTPNQIQHLNEIPNRYHFIEIVSGIATREKRFSLMLLDVMRFSDVSAAFGHKAGDELLLQIVNRINLIYDNALAFGRISGDIFGVVFTKTTAMSSMRAEHERLFNHFKTPLSVNNTAFIADFNVGVAIRKNPDSSVNTIISLAETALKKSKSNRHENFTILNDDTNEATGRGLTLKADLTRALAKDELELYFQPKVDLNDYSIIGGECLLRWNHPLDGVVFPGTLLKAAESYNMMNELGYWTIDHALSALAKIHEFGHQIKISVNLSPTQLYDQHLTSTLKLLVNKYNIKTHLLEIELTEDVALSNSLLVKRQLADIADMGISISMDDFGKGYSNLSFIRDLQLSAIKIDKAFILALQDSPVNCAIVKATKLICDAKQCETYAEGIETVEQLEMLKSMGVDKGQGFLFSQAVPIEEFLSMLKVGNFSKIIHEDARKIS